MPGAGGPAFSLAASGMTSGWFHELKRRLEVAVDKERSEIGGGSCVTSVDTPADVIGMMYRERVGFVLGLQRAMQIAGNVEAGREVD